MSQGVSLNIVGVASPYAFDVVESALRTHLEICCVDNFGEASAELPGITRLSESTDRAVPFTVGLAAARHRAVAIASCAEDGFTQPFTLVDASAVIARTSTLGHLVYVNAGVVIGSNTIVGCGSNVNRSASLGHDNHIGYCASIGPGATLAGGVILGDLVTVGAGATILPGISVGVGAIVGAGAVVTKDVAAVTTVVGNPARPLETSHTPALTEASVATGCPYCSGPTA